MYIDLLHFYFFHKFINHVLNKSRKVNLKRKKILNSMFYYNFFIFVKQLDKIKYVITLLFKTLIHTVN